MCKLKQRQQNSSQMWWPCVQLVRCGHTKHTDTRPTSSTSLVRLTWPTMVRPAFQRPEPATPPRLFHPPPPVRLTAVAFQQRHLWSAAATAFNVRGGEKNGEKLPNGNVTCSWEHFCIWKRWWEFLNFSIFFIKICSIIGYAAWRSETFVLLSSQGSEERGRARRDYSTCIVSRDE